MIKTYKVSPHPIITSVWEVENGEFVKKSDFDAAILDHEKECETLASTVSDLSHKLELLQEQILIEEDIKEDLSRKLEIAKEHMNHADNCEIHHGHRPCDCGLRQALQELEK